ncbi:hypothetical protein [Runella slithyformis]|uniref:Uncharacterized protein n=1 Tax=Runella slithyformis (strain ATCC 29530 / DSM 19594 / LMG 11500 / NCIMB 11436 / LSU 4) TaxID=761193 RepID=A0A7U4E5E3_RUNSL|nr:hypothetical protein [Runella slithyformis]AEI48378.1 hypothetical protein Runsl_1959 [Runella slithyformis DSM 19594]
MKTIILSCLFVFGVSISLISQNRTTKIYFFSLPSSKLVTTSNPEDPIKINKCTLLETNLDSLGLELLSEKKVYLPLEAGRTYYYHKILTNGSGIGTAIVSECTEKEFWLNVYYVGAGTYRHYFLDKQSGLKLLEEKSR